MKKETAVEWFVDELFAKSGLEVTKESNSKLFDLIQQAKQMEKQQFIDLHIETMKEGLKFEDSQVWDEKYLPKIKSMAEKTWDKLIKSK